jgi:hypothetical protein
MQQKYRVLVKTPQGALGPWLNQSLEQAINLNKKWGALPGNTVIVEPALPKRGKS